MRDTVYKIAVCQMDSGEDKAANLAFAADMAAEAAGAGASLLAFPENMNFMGHGMPKAAERPDGETLTRLAELARVCHLWIMTGSIPVVHENGNPENTLFLIAPDGRMICRYSKLHMFDICMEDGPSYRESGHTTQGGEIVLADTPLGRMGFSICYDLRFGEMYRLMALAGAQLIFVPAAFTARTGEAHWEALLRARAIENGLYIAAPAQTGHKSTGNTWGHSMVIDPWGDVTAEKKEGTGLIFADIDLSMPEKIRSQIPSLKNRREDVYSLAAEPVRIFS